MSAQPRVGPKHYRLWPENKDKQKITCTSGSLNLQNDLNLVQCFFQEVNDFLSYQYKYFFLRNYSKAQGQLFLLYSFFSLFYSPKSAIIYLASPNHYFL